jgi:hypothetical protein
MGRFALRATPSAVVVGPDGRVASRPAAAIFEIEELVRLTLRRQAAPAALAS